MSRDQHLDHAIDRHSRLADDTSYSIYTTRDDEGFAEHSWSDGVANNELRPRFTDVAWPTVTTTSTCASDNGSSSRRGPLSQLATANNKKISGSVQQSTSNVEFLDPSDIYSLNNQDANHWSGNALDPALLAISPNFLTSWDHDYHGYHESGQSNALAKRTILSSYDIHQHTHGASSNQHAAQTPTQQHLHLPYVGMLCGQSYSESMHMSGVLVTPGSDERLDIFEDFEPFDGVRPFAGDASSLEQMPSTASESSGLQSAIPAFSTGPGVMACTSCTTVFRGAYARGNYRRHRRQKHMDHHIGHVCEVSSCSKHFKRGDARLKHYRRHHPHLINAPESRNDRVTGHCRINTSDETWNEEQDYLPSTFLPPRTSGDSEATYRCDYQGCERGFDQRADLLRHKRTHTCKYERPHKCAQCRQSFLYPKDLKRHQATHLDVGDMPMFHCEVASCQYGPGKQGFSRKDGMVRHMRRFHPELIIEKET